MLPSKGFQLLRAARLISNSTNKQFPQIIRNGHNWQYRSAPGDPPKIVMNAAEFVGAVAWWWVLWHLWTEPGHVTGEFEFPDASKWTDQELGIPSD